MNHGKINIIIVDDNHFFLNGIESFLKDHKKYHVLTCFLSGEDLLKSQVINEAKIILIDIVMPGVNGIMTAKEIDMWHKNIKTVAMTMYPEEIYLNSLIECGFKGFINKFNICNNLIKVLDDVLNDKMVFPNNMRLY